MYCMQYIDILGYKVRYHEEGDGNNLLLIHGLGGSLDSFKYNRELSKDLHIIALDLLGFGYSDKPKIRYSISMFTRLIHAFLDKLSIDNTSILGSSLGGQIAAEFAIRYPKLVDKLVLISPAGITPYSFRGSKDLHLYASIFDAKDKEDLKKRLMSDDEEYIDYMYNYIKMDNAKYAFYSALEHSSK
ncbi:MAG: alpha/beta hydrolase, partial [Candidatus Nitrosothermus koennekii]